MDNSINTSFLLSILKILLDRKGDDLKALMPQLGRGVGPAGQDMC